MKKLFLALLALVALTLPACGSATSTDSTDSTTEALKPIVEIMAIAPGTMCSLSNNYCVLHDDAANQNSLLTIVTLLGQAGAEHGIYSTGPHTATYFYSLADYASFAAAVNAAGNHSIKIVFDNSIPGVNKPVILVPPII